MNKKQNVKKLKSIFLVLTLITLLSLSSSFVFSEEVAGIDLCSTAKIALLGDSITNSAGTAGWGNELRKLCNNNPINYAHGGKLTIWMLQRLKGEKDDSSPYISGKILGQGYQYLIVKGGTNDISSSRSFEHITNNLAQIYSIAKQDGIKVIAGTISPYNKEQNPERNELVKQVNSWIKQQHSEGKIDGVIDFYQFLVGTEPCMNSQYASSCNNVHPNTAGYKAMAEKVKSELFGSGSDGSISATQTTSINLGEGVKILHIGDSHSAQTYGKELAAQLRSGGATVRHYGQCGSRPSWWLEKDSTKNANSGVSGHATTCGSLFILEDGKKNLVKTRATPLLPNLMSEFKPDYVAVSLGANLHGFVNKKSGDEWFVTKASRLMAEQIVAAGSKCIWIGVPQGPNKVHLENLYERIKAGVGDKCTFIDSRPHSNFDFCGNGKSCCCSANVHFDAHGAAGKNAGAKWARAIYAEIKKSGVSMPTQVATQSLVPTQVVQKGPPPKPAYYNFQFFPMGSKTTVIGLAKSHWGPTLVKQDLAKDWADLFGGTILESSAENALSIKSDVSQDLNMNFNLVDGISVNTPDYGQMTLNPTQQCPSDICEWDPMEKGFSRDNIDGLVIHCTVGGSAKSTANTFKKRMADRLKEKPGKRYSGGTQYVFGRDGKYIQQVKEEMGLYHTSDSKRDKTNIGIEVANSESLCKQVCTGGVCKPDACQKPNVPTGIPEYNYWKSKSTKYLETYSETQLKALVKLSAEIFLRQNLKIDGLIRHLDVTMSGKGTHTDPGPHFPWDKFKKNVLAAVNEYKKQAGNGAVSEGASSGSLTSAQTGGIIPANPEGNHDPVPQVYTKYKQLESVYGTTESGIKSQLVSIDFMGRKVPVHKNAKKAFEYVLADIKQCPEAQSYPYWSTVWTHNYRCVLHKGTPPNCDIGLSAHSFGTAIDINPKGNPYSKTKLVYDIPPCVIGAFKRYGFRWGGDWKTAKDAMHFEFMGNPASLA
ncbi:hypothetical protein HN587_06575 [Candidatus Woesearchaeota archaeon]|jgi:lysophospholipase L1-like esterase/N-acetyl-anhydromuramyl-L-alanine amidase AmpD|nr:hypothetical protein [Candidatus Woesearchaeota archaeon]